MRKSEEIQKLKQASSQFSVVAAGDLEDALAASVHSVQVVFAHVPWCNTTEALLPQVEDLANDFAEKSEQVGFFRVTLEEDKGELLSDMWLSSTVKVFQNGQEVAQLADPSLGDLEVLIKEKLG